MLKVEGQKHTQARSKSHPDIESYTHKRSQGVVSWILSGFFLAGCCGGEHDSLVSGWLGGLHGHLDV